LKKELHCCYDSIHGDFEGSVTADLKKNALIINGTVHIITANGPEEIDYTYLNNNALVIDNTGLLQLKKH
jgi:glyceraldehyde 3-phosphate dehydrogenase